MDLSVLDRLNWLQQQQQIVPPELLQILASEEREELKRIQSYLGHNHDQLQSFRHFPEFEPDYDTIDGCISRTNSFQMETVKKKKNNEENLAIALQNKRKPEGKRENKKKKKIKAEDETESSMKGKSNMSNTETSSEIEKPDYIHVRARRGEATDRHSLAERARREKISKKMKCLQDIVPGCSKVTGKAGMLDEIINYVQSLQQQVEFLSMKLSVLNPELEFHINDLSTKQFQAYFTDLPETFLKQSMIDQTSSSWENHSECLYNSLRTDSTPKFFSLQ